MPLNLPLLIDLHTLHDSRQASIDMNLLCSNSGRINHDYHINEKVYLLVNYKTADKAREIYRGPYQIVKVHTNNTVTLRTRPRTLDRVRIRRIKPTVNLP